MNTPTLLSSRRLRRFVRPLLWFVAFLLVAGLVNFAYANWYRVVVDPPPLDPALTERRQTQILTSEYNQVKALSDAWRAVPEPLSVSDVFDPNH